MPEQPELIKKFFSTAFPNPQRQGCPDQSVLRAIAADTLPLDHPGLAHVASCSPCYIEVERLTKQVRAARRRHVQWIAAAVVAVVGAAVLWAVYTQRRTIEQTSVSETTKAPVPQLPAPAPQASTKTPINVPLDLRPFAPTRNIVSPRRKPPALTVPAQLVNLQITLPLGSDDGSYEVRIQSSGGQVLRNTNGRAIIANGDTHLEVSLNLSDLAPGSYTMLYRHVDASWHRVPLSLTK